MANGMRFHKEEPNQTIDAFVGINQLTATEASYALVEAKEAGVIQGNGMFWWRGVKQDD